MLDVKRAASNEITLVRLSVHLSVRLSVRHYIFSRSDHQFFLILYTVIADYDIYLVTDKANFYEKNWRPKFGPKGPKSGPK